MTDVHAWADQLRQYATHFEVRDWRYTRDLGDVKRITHTNDWTGYDHPVRRIKRALTPFLGYRRKWERDLMGRWFAWRHPLVTIRASFTYGSLPDGVLDNGAIITHWEETGEYLQYVQPSVGALLADLMDAHPDLPEVQAIAVEMKRINDDYGARVADWERNSRDGK